jgi:hypothetical protein
MVRRQISGAELYADVAGRGKRYGTADSEEHWRFGGCDTVELERAKQEKDETNEERCMHRFSFRAQNARLGEP